MKAHPGQLNLCVRFHHSVQFRTSKLLISENFRLYIFETWSTIRSSTDEGHAQWTLRVGSTFNFWFQEFQFSTTLFKFTVKMSLSPEARASVLQCTLQEVTAWALIYGTESETKLQPRINGVGKQTMLHIQTLNLKHIPQFSSSRFGKKANSNENKLVSSQASSKLLKHRLSFKCSLMLVQPNHTY